MGERDIAGEEEVMDESIQYWPQLQILPLLAMIDMVRGGHSS